jgi:hypothetical protein
MRALVLRAVVALAVLVGASSARADKNDLTLERLIGPPSMPGVINDPSSIAVQTQFRSLMSELGVVMAPHLLSPADTLGWSGFQLSFEPAFTQISDKADYWRLGVRNVSGGFLPTLTVMARKGLWLPFPAVEMGVGGTYLLDSQMYALQVYMKIGIHEGYHRFPLPSIGVRGAVSHIFGASQVDMTIVSVDASISKSFGIAGTLKLDPYFGGNALLNITRSQVIDTTPMIDAYRQGPGSLDLNANTTFPDPDTIVRWRIFVGLRLVYWKIALTAEFNYTLCNDSGSNCTRANPTKITDRSDGQSQVTFSGSAFF